MRAYTGVLSAGGNQINKLLLLTSHFRLHIYGDTMLVLAIEYRLCRYVVFVKHMPSDISEGDPMTGNNIVYKILLSDMNIMFLHRVVFHCFTRTFNTDLLYYFCVFKLSNFEGCFLDR